MARISKMERAKAVEREVLIEEAKTLSWFHSIDFGDYVSPPRTKTAIVPNSTLQPIWEFLRHIDVTGLDCMDVGAADGLVAFTLKQRGARRVVATDGGPRRQFELARELTGLDVEYVPDMMDIDMSSRLEPASCDLIVMAGLIYHVFSPLAAIAACRKALRPGGILMIETCYTGGTAPAAILNTETDPPLSAQYSTYWLPTPSCVEGMLKLASFDVISSASVGKLLEDGGCGRIGYVARAASPDDIPNRKPQLVKTHETVRAVPELNFSSFRRRTTVMSKARYTGPRRHISVSVLSYPANVPLLPTIERVTV